MDPLTLVMGASPNPHRYSCRAVQMLQEYGHPVEAFGIRKGTIGKVSIITCLERVSDHALDTISLYLAPENQKQYYDWILEAGPRRVIMNPGTENKILEEKLKHNGIEAVEACTLVMLRTGQY